MDFTNWNDCIPQIYQMPNCVDNHMDGTQNAYLSDDDYADFYKKRQEFSIRLEYEACREAASIRGKLALNEQLAMQSEAESERRKSVYEVILLDENGDLTVVTKNTRKDFGPRMLANFTKPEIFRVENVATKEEAFIITLWIGEKEKYFSLRLSKMGDSDYLIKKFNAIGADFFVEKQSTKKKYAVQLLGLLLRQDYDKFEIPDKPGWYKTSEGKINFCEIGEVTWNKIIHS